MLLLLPRHKLITSAHHGRKIFFRNIFDDSTVFYCYAAGCHRWGYALLGKRHWKLGDLWVKHFVEKDGDMVDPLLLLSRPVSKLSFISCTLYLPILKQNLYSDEAVVSSATCSMDHGPFRTSCVWCF
jgi:hypothetical protein